MKTYLAIIIGTTAVIGSINLINAPNESLKYTEILDQISSIKSTELDSSASGEIAVLSSELNSTENSLTSTNIGGFTDTTIETQPTNEVSKVLENKKHRDDYEQQEEEDRDDDNDHEREDED